MSPDQPKARTIAKAAWANCEAEEWAAAVEKYEEALPLLDHSHWHTQEILGEYALALYKVGRFEDQVAALNGALESAISVDGPLSLAAGIARHFLVDALFRQNRLSEAKETLAHWPDAEIEKPWLLNFSAALLALKEGDQSQFEYRCKKVLESAPDGKWQSIDDLKTALLAEVRT